MKMKRNSFFAFCFSCIPGAGQMYMGFMKHGISIMGIMTLIIAAMVIFESPILGLGLPILWFYSFFDVHHKRGIPQEEFEKLEDHSLLNDDTMALVKKYTSGRGKLIIACGLIFFGIYMLYNTFIDLLWRVIPDSYVFSGLNYITRKFPQLIIAVLIIYIGYRMIVGKKIEIEEQQSSYENKDEMKEVHSLESKK